MRDLGTSLFLAITFKFVLLLICMKVEMLSISRAVNDSSHAFDVIFKMLGSRKATLENLC